ncbi:MAG: MoaD/ThiS family protein [Sphaerochaetaceae bacterium]
MITVEGKGKVEWKENLYLKEVLDALGVNEIHLTILLNNKIIPWSEHHRTIVPDNSVIKKMYISQGG